MKRANILYIYTYVLKFKHLLRVCSTAILLSKVIIVRNMTNNKIHLSKMPTQTIFTICTCVWLMYYYYNFFLWYFHFFCHTHMNVSLKIQRETNGKKYHIQKHLLKFCNFNMYIYINNIKNYICVTCVSKKLIIIF